MALPAALNDVISVTGSIPSRFLGRPEHAADRSGDRHHSSSHRASILIFSEATVGGAPTTTTTGGGATGAAATATGNGANITLLTAANFEIYSDRVLASANRDWSTDFAAPAIDVPTFRRTFATSTTTTTTTSTTTTDARDHNVFDEAGTSLSAGIVTGAYSMVSSALNYWAQLNSTPGGVTSDAYLTTPVGVNALTFGSHPFINLQAYNNPNGINSILAWTADSAVDPNDGLSASTPPTLANGVTRNFDRISIGNAIAAIEGDIAINYLLAHKDFQYIDTNNNGLITAQELQNFEDNSTQMGMPEAGAMARLLGGTAQIPQVGVTAANEAVEEPSVLQRRFNFFDYAADGQLNGSISIPQLKMLSHTLLPTPDSFSISNRARASANGTLLNPTPDRNFQALQHLLPSSQLVPNKVVEKFARVTPKEFKIDAGRDQFPGQTFPLYSLFAADRSVHQGTPTPSASPTPTATTSPTSTGTPASSSPTTTPSSTTTPQTAGSLTASSPTSSPSSTTPTTTPTSTAATMTPSSTTTPTPTGTTASTNSGSSSNAVEQFLEAAHGPGGEQQQRHDHVRDNLGDHDPADRRDAHAGRDPDSHRRDPHAHALSQRDDVAAAGADDHDHHARHAGSRGDSDAGAHAYADTVGNQHGDFRLIDDCNDGHDSDNHPVFEPDADADTDHRGPAGGECARHEHRHRQQPQLRDDHPQDQAQEGHGGHQHGAQRVQEAVLIEPRRVSRATRTGRTLTQTRTGGPVRNPARRRHPRAIPVRKNAFGAVRPSCDNPRGVSSLV